MDSDLRSFIRALSTLSSPEKASLFHNLGFILVPVTGEALKFQNKFKRTIRRLLRFHPGIHSANSIYVSPMRCAFCRQGAVFSTRAQGNRYRLVVHHSKNCLGKQLLKTVKDSLRLE